MTPKRVYDPAFDNPVLLEVLAQLLESGRTQPIEHYVDRDFVCDAYIHLSNEEIEAVKAFMEANESEQH